MIMLRLCRIVATVVVALMATNGPLSAQTTDDPFDFRDIPSDAVNSYYLGMGGGYLGSLVFTNYDGVNQFVGTLGLPEFDGPMFLSGGGGLVSALVINTHLRIGFYGMGGSKRVAADVTSNGVAATRSLEFRQSVAAAQVDYAIRLSSSLTLVPGVMIGAGGFDLEVTQSPKAGIDASILNPDSASVGYNARLSSSRVFYYPALNLEWVPARILMLRLGGGYSGTFDAAWHDNNDVEVSGMPTINTNGASVQFGLFVGLFQTK